MSQISQLSKLAISVAVCITAGVPHTTSCSSATKLAACGHFRDKSLFLPFLPAPDTKQTWQQCLRKSMADIIYPKSGFGRASASGPSTWEVGCVGGLTATNIHRFRCPGVSGSPLTGTDLVQTRLVSLSLEPDRTGPNRWQNPGPARTAAGINQLVS